MVIFNPYFPGAFIIPLKTDPPLSVYPDAVLAFSFAFQSFKAIRGKPFQVIQGCRIIQDLQPADSLSFESAEFFYEHPGIEFLSILVFE